MLINARIFIIILLDLDESHRKEKKREWVTSFCLVITLSLQILIVAAQFTVLMIILFNFDYSFICLIQFFRKKKFLTLIKNVTLALCVTLKFWYESDIWKYFEY